MTPKREAAKKPGNRIPRARLAEMIEEATVDAYDDSEQATGWFTMLEDNLELPFETEVLGITVRVTRIEQRDDHQLVAIAPAVVTSKRSGSATFRCRHRCLLERSGLRPTVYGLAGDDR